MNKKYLLQTKNLFLQFLGLVFKINPFKNRPGYQLEAMFILTCGLSIFYLISIISFNPLDSSYYSYSFPTNNIVKNMGGNLGVFLSSHSIYFLGLFSIFIPLSLIFMTISYIVQKTYFVLKHQLLGLILINLCILFLLTHNCPTLYFKNHMINTTGIIGLNFYLWCIQFFGKVGAHIIIITLGLTGLVLVLQLNYISLLIRYIFKKILSLFNKILKFLFIPIPILYKLNYKDSNTEHIDTPITPQQNRNTSTQPENLTDKILEQINTHKSDTIYDEEIIHVSDLNYICPPYSIFQTSSKNEYDELWRQECDKTATLLTKTLNEFDIQGQIVGIRQGPVVTVYEFELSSGTKLSKITSLIDDIALALKVDSILIHPSKDKRAVGIQVPNIKRLPVLLGDILNSQEFKSSQSPLTFAIGKSIYGDNICVDLSQMPHLLAAGATGSGKSVAINTLLCSVIVKASPKDVKMILVDPKVLELSVYEGIPHLLTPVITEAYKASLALKWTTNEMERRYKLMQFLSVRHITGFNALWDKLDDKQKNKIKDELSEDNIGKMPYILIVIDELADLMLTAPKDVESSIQRLAQKARACGIHLVLATQRPSVDIITGVIKANLPFRIAFQVVSKHDSRTIIDQIGADKLLGKGDMLFQRPGAIKLQRLHGAFVSDKEVLNLVKFLKQHYKPEYNEDLIEWIEQENAKIHDLDNTNSNKFNLSEEPKFEQAMQLAKTYGVISASFLQRYLKIGYNRAARIVETMEAKGMVTKADGSKPRKWIGDVNNAAINKNQI